MSEPSADPLKEKPLRELVAHWKAESKRVKELADKERSKSGRESLMAQSVRYWMCADELEQALAAQPEPGETRERARLNDWQRDFAIRALRCYKESYARNGSAFEDDIESTIEALAAGEKRVSDTSVT